jgi:hypothetical protein
MRPIRVKTLAATVAALAVAGAAQAEMSAYSTRLTETSRREALGGRALPLLKMAEGPGREERLARLLDVLAESPDRRIHVRNPGRRSDSPRSTVLFGGDGSWYLKVSEDGTRFRYQGNIDDAREKEADATLPKLDLATLERLGLDFVTTRLRTLVPLGRDERLVFLASRYLREGSATATTPFDSQVVGNLAVFGREIGGTYVAGPGSKVAVWFSNRGEPMGFFADWPAYDVVGPAKPTLDIAGVRELLARHGSHPLDTIERNMRQFQCGYMDLGLGKRGRAPVQAGCVVQHAGPLPDGDGELHYGSLESVPISTEMVEDPDWPVTGCIATGKPGNDCRDLRHEPDSAPES